MTAIAELDLTIVVDVAGVTGVPAGGCWRDRAEAALRLYRSVAALAGEGITADQLPDGVLTDEDWVSTPGNWVFFPEWVLVLPGAAREAVALPADTGPWPPVRLVYAPGAADDEVVGQAAMWSVDSPCLVVTADRGLRRRCEDHGALAAEPGWLPGLH